MSKSLDEMTQAELNELFPVILSEHDPAWRERYLKEKTVLEKAVGKSNIVRINHIGSTAVPNLIAKASVDILLEIEKDTDIEKFISGVRSADYGCVERLDNPPPHMMLVKGYTPQGISGQVFHAHVRYSGDWDELYFRDYLMTHPEIAGEYGKLKIELAKQYRYDRDAYTEAKTEFIQRITGLVRGKVNAGG